MFSIPLVAALMAGCRSDYNSCKKTEVPEGFEDAVSTTDAGALVSYPIGNDVLPEDVYVDRASFPDGVDADKIFQAIRNSFVPWENELDGLIRFNVMEADETVMEEDRRYGGTNTVFFTDEWADDECQDNCDTLARATDHADLYDGVVSEFDVAFNARDHAWTVEDDPENNQTGSPFGRLHDVQNVMTHEVGHVLGLADIECEDNDRQTMCGTADAGETVKRNLSEEDIATLNAIYEECEVELESAAAQ